ncbi:NUDIX domain [Seminavis robusta]|uniref:NUDIX domain n=1 Tax=Seminavis robusta TaxID=568900 RepID=A0A9N8HGH7_9STRA|nr:NUDIX domain [Seminavis robusta]|eukprot:Sro579_g169920.1 NUDIX domain (262) ;mRNA; r:4145-4930
MDNNALNKKYRRKGGSLKNVLSSQDAVLRISFAMNVLFGITWLWSRLIGNEDSFMWIRGDEHVWHGGGTPYDNDHRGSCWCGADGYCLCTPFVAFDLILVSQEDDDTFFWVKQRKDTNQLATIGGFLEVGDSLELALHRELKEQVGIVLEQQSGNTQFQMLGVYSDPRRDNLRRNVAVAYVVRLPHAIYPKEAKDVRKIAIKDIEQHDFYADHKMMLLDYRHSLQAGKHGLATTTSLNGALEGVKLQSAQKALGITRSLCM